MIDVDMREPVFIVLQGVNEEMVEALNILHELPA